MKYEIPKINKRIRLVVNLKADGNISAFSRIVGVSQQRITRLFLPDQKAGGKYPTVPADLLISIAKHFKDINLQWLLIGDGVASTTYAETKNTSEVNEPSVAYGKSKCDDKDYIISLQKEVIKSLKEQLKQIAEKKAQI